MSFRFKAEGFQRRVGGTNESPVVTDCHEIADKANALLDEYLKSCPRVYHDKADHEFCWNENPNGPFDDKTAVLFNVKEIEK